MELLAQTEPHLKALVPAATGCCRDMTQLRTLFSMLLSEQAQSCSHGTNPLAEIHLSDCRCINLCKVTSRPWSTCMWSQRGVCFNLLEAESQPFNLHIPLKDDLTLHGLCKCIRVMPWPSIKVLQKDNWSGERSSHVTSMLPPHTVAT